jgi:hypothetical protein
MAYLRHGVHAVGLDRRDGEHGHGTMLLTRAHTLDVTRAAMRAADEIVTSSAAADLEVDEHAVDEAAREACFILLEKVGSYDELAICTEIDKVCRRCCLL